MTEDQNNRETERREPLVSWLLCTHRDDALLHRAIRSCLHQSLQGFELIIVVNGPRSAEIEAALQNRYSNHSCIRIISTPVHLLNFSLSLGLHAARAPYIARMDGDDVAAPERLERQLNYMMDNPHIAVVGSDYRLIDAYGNEHGTVLLPKSDSEIRKALLWGNPICHPAVMFRRDVVRSQGGYLGGRNAEDYDLWLRICLSRKLKFANLPDLLLSYNVESGGGARRSREAYANVAAAQFRNFIVSRDLRWLAAALVTALKALVRANRQ